MPAIIQTSPDNGPSTNDCKTNEHGPDTEAFALERLLEVSAVVLQQAVDLVDSTLTSDDQLTKHSQYMPGSTIGALATLSLGLTLIDNSTGKHLRHARDHFALLMDTVSASQPPYVLNYDVRSRNTPMESSRRAAHDSLVAAIEQLRTVVPTMKMDEPLTLNAVTPYAQTLQSTFGREVRLIATGSACFACSCYSLALVCGSPRRASLVNG